jgi:hypothetical protein
MKMKMNRWKVRRELRRFKRYKKFVEENEQELNLHQAIYGKTCVLYIPWNIVFIIRWIFGGEKPGFILVNPEEIDNFN